MAHDDAFAHALARFEEIVYGFEFPYGVELLSTVHYLVSSDPERGRSVDSLIEAIGTWSERKRQLFQPRQALVALEHLKRVEAVPTG